ncbi:MAG TPA: sulfatase-like hydrolase/transferase [Thermoanaerobaculia bacterium]|nr:sulfatase-like hydrolase/transferase [Thermoanaerobaculia bacterium]
MASYAGSDYYLDFVTTSGESRRFSGVLPKTVSSAPGSPADVPMPGFLTRPADPKPRRVPGGILLGALGLGFCLVAPLLRASLSGVPVRPSAAPPGKPAAAAPAPAKPDLRANLLLITIDTLRPDALGWVAGKNNTPSIDAYAAEGVRFPAAVSPVPLTLPAHASILSGLLPRRHGVRDDGQPLSAGVLTLARRLEGSGYSTAAFVSGAPLESIYGLDRGFTVYDDRLTEGAEGATERKAFDTTTAALAWIAKARSPWFVWVHYYDPHDPYEPPQSFLRPGPRGAYDGEVAYLDAWVGRLRAGVPAAAAANLLTVLAGDYSEALGEHREKTHGLFLYDATTAVPLVFHFPGRLKPAESREPARLIDLAPTTLDLLGVAPLPGIDGISLKPLLEGKPQSVPAAYLETRLPWTRFGWAPLAALRDGPWKLIEAPRPELYDLSKDGGEGTNRIDAEHPVARRLLAALREIEKRPGASGSGVSTTAAARRVLGDRGAARSARQPPAGLPDPKDRLDLHDRLVAADEALDEGRFAAAIAAFDAVLAADPNDRFAALRSGTALLQAGRLDEAAKRLARAVELDPEGVEARFALATALTRLGRFGAAVPHWMELASRQPRRVDAWSSLGLALGRTGKPADLDRAAAALAEAARLDPANPRRRSDLADAHLALARRALAQGNRTAANRALLTAVEIDPAARDRAAADPKLVVLVR